MESNSSTRATHSRLRGRELDDVEGAVADVEEVGVGDDLEGLVVGDDAALVVLPSGRVIQGVRDGEGRLNTWGFFFGRLTWTFLSLPLWF